MSCRPIFGAVIRKIDVVALTHAHDDHAGGLPAIIENFHPSAALDRRHGSSAAWSAVRAKPERKRSRFSR